MCWLSRLARSDANRTKPPTRVQFLNATCSATTVDEPVRRLLGAFNVTRQQTRGSCPETTQAASLSAGKSQRFYRKPWQYRANKLFPQRSGR